MSVPIPSRCWQTPDGKQIGLATSYVPAGSEIVTRGWTVEHPDGTTGIGRVPFKTEAEAQAWCDANPHFRGMSQD